MATTAGPGRAAPLVAFLLLALAPAGCGGGGGGGVSLSGLESLTVEPVRAAVGVGGTERFRTIGHYADGTSRDVSASVAWSVPLDGAVATVDRDGVATGLALGTATVVATQPATGLTASAFLEVERFGREGRSDAPLPLPLDTPHAGEVNTGKSHYVFEVDPGRHYYVFLTEATDDLDLQVFGDAAHARTLCASSHADTEQQCVTRPAPTDDRLYVVVDGVWTNTFFGGEGGAEFTLRVVPGWVDEGSAEAPVALSPGVAHDGMVGQYASHYTVSTTFGAEYAVKLGGPTDDADLSVSGASGFWATRCAPDLPGTSDEQCVLRADGEVMPIQVFGGGTSVGAAFSLEVRETAPPLVAEGSAATPFDLSDRVPWEGQVDDGTSYYAYDVVPGRSYRVRVEAASAEIWMYVSDGDATFSSYDCAASNGSLGEGVARCEVVPATSDRLYVQVRGWNASLGVTYRVVVEPIDYAAEGTEAPLALAAPPTVHTGQVDPGVSRYEVPVVAGARYEVAVRDLVNDVDLRVYGDAALTQVLCASETAGDVAEACVTDPRPSIDRLWVVVDGGPSGFGSSYTLTVDRLWEREGTEAAPEALDVGVAHAAQTARDAASWYAFAVDPGRTYAVSISANTDDVYFATYDRPEDFGSTGRCSAWGPGTCTVRPVEADVLYVRASSSYTDHGAGFELKVEEVPYTPEGSAGTPLALGAAPLSHAGETDGTASWYAVDVTTAAPHEVRLAGRAVAADLRVYDAADFATPLCASTTAGVAEEGCLATPTGSSLYVEVDGSVSGFGAVYTLEVHRHYVSEGAVAARPKDPGPVAVALGVPYAGQVSDDGPSYYQTAVTAGSSHTVTITGLTGEAYLYVYGADGSFTTSVARDDSSGTGEKTAGVSAVGGDVLYFKMVARYGEPGSAYTVLVQ